MAFFHQANYFGNIFFPLFLEHTTLLAYLHCDSLRWTLIPTLCTTSNEWCYNEWHQQKAFQGFTCTSFWGAFPRTLASTVLHAQLKLLKTPHLAPYCHKQSTQYENYPTEVCFCAKLQDHHRENFQRQTHQRKPVNMSTWHTGLNSRCPFLTVHSVEEQFESRLPLVEVLLAEFWKEEIKFQKLFLEA